MAKIAFRIEHLGRLVRIALSDKAIKKYMDQIAGVLNYVAKAQKLQMRKSAHESVGDFTKWLGHKSAPLDRKIFWKNVPATEDELIKVKSVFHNE